MRKSRHCAEDTSHSSRFHGRRGLYAAMMSLGCIAAVVATTCMPMGAGDGGNAQLSQLTFASNQAGDIAAVNAMSSSGEKQELPSTVDSSLADSDTVVSPTMAVKGDGTAVDVATGDEITNPQLVGTVDEQPDPLAKTDGDTYVPVEVGEVRAANSHDGADGDTAVDADGAVTATAATNAVGLQDDGSFAATTVAERVGNSYGAYWGTYNGASAMFNSDGTVAIPNASAVIDVSSWQGRIDWNKVKAAGVEGAIIRIGYGWDNPMDSTAAYNISQCEQLGIPFGIYLYSYAYSSEQGTYEANTVIRYLRQLGISSTQMTFPIYYDLEAWTWTGHAHPTDANTYGKIVRNFFSTLASAGYSNASVYSYTSYLNTALNSTYLHQLTGWVAQYSSELQYSNWSSAQCGWQYSASGAIDGISGDVDLDAMSSSPGTIVRLDDDNYYVNSAVSDAYSLSIDGESTKQGAQTRLGRGTGTSAQQFAFTRLDDGSYRITDVKSGLCLDVPGADAHSGARVQQYQWNGTKAQRWYVIDAGFGAYYLQSALGNWVLDLAGGNAADGKVVQLYAPNATAAQKWKLASVTVSVPTSGAVRITSAVDSSHVMTFTDAQKSQGAKLRIASWYGANSQLFQFVRVGNGVYEIKNLGSGKFLDVPGNGTADGTQIQQWEGNGTPAQKWYVRNGSNGTVVFLGAGSGKTLDLSGASVTDGNSIDLYSSNGTNAQRWILSRGNTRVSITAGTYSIRAYGNSTYAFDVAGGSHANSANVQLYALNGTSAQKWDVRVDSSGFLTFVNAGSGKALDLSSARAVNGSNIQQYFANGTKAQKWRVIAKNDGSFVLQSAVNGWYVIDLSGGSLANGSNIQLYSSNNTDAQRWYFAKL